MTLVFAADLLSNRHDFQEVNSFARHTAWLHPLLIGFASYGVVLFGLFLLAGWWIARRANDPRRVGLALLAGVATLVAVALNQPIANRVEEARPFTVFPHALVLVHRSTDFAFPSDHSVMAGAVAAGVFFVSRRLGAVAILAALLMAFDRVYVGAHWPGDVVAGLALGALVAAVPALLFGGFLGGVVTALARTPLRPLVLADGPNRPGDPLRA